jgi:hypothetical protein
VGVIRDDGSSSLLFVLDPGIFPTLFGGGAKVLTSLTSIFAKCRDPTVSSSFFPENGTCISLSRQRHTLSLCPIELSLLTTGKLICLALERVETFHQDQDTQKSGDDRDPRPTRALKECLYFERRVFNSSTMEKPTPRINAPLREKFIGMLPTVVLKTGQTVRIIAKPLELQGDTAVVDAHGQITVHLNRVIVRLDGTDV